MRCGDFTMWDTPEEMLKVDPNVFCGKDVEDEESKSPASPEVPRNVSARDLHNLHQKLEENWEICGVITPGNGKLGDSRHQELQLESRDIGPYINDGDRGSCKSTNKWINFHTHPYVTYPWPSTEDIFKVLTERSGAVLWGSLIFTEWGIWEIYSAEKVDKSYLDSIQEEWTTNTSDKLFYDLNLEENSEVPDLNTVHGALQSFLDKWGRGWEDVGLEITLTDWRDIPEYYPLQTGLQSVPI